MTLSSVRGGEFPNFIVLHVDALARFRGLWRGQSHTYMIHIINPKIRTQLCNYKNACLVHLQCEAFCITKYSLFYKYKYHCIIRHQESCWNLPSYEVSDWFISVYEVSVFYEIIIFFAVCPLVQRSYRSLIYQWWLLFSFNAAWSFSKRGTECIAAANCCLVCLA